ncbi:hypothetical protein N2152v2_003942 [Parachlorella kessleri]
MLTRSSFLRFAEVKLPGFLSTGSQQVQESGPLASLSGVLDVGARRVLPGHLLRRSRVLSTLRLGDSFQQRIALTACTGEESVFEWALQQVPGSLDWNSDLEEDAAASGTKLEAAPSAESAAPQSQPTALPSREQREKQPRKDQLEVRRQVRCKTDLRQAEQPRRAVSSSTCSTSDSSSIALLGLAGESEAAAIKAAPEAVVKAQLAALQRGDVFGASCFNIWRSHSSAQGLGIHYQLLRDKLQEPPFDLLLWHAEAMLGPAALPSQRVMLQEVVVLGSGGSMEGRGGGSSHSRGSSSTSRGWGRGAHGTPSRGSSGSAAGAGGLGLGGRQGGPSSGRFLWRLGMQANGCWQVTGIEVVDTF